MEERIQSVGFLVRQVFEDLHKMEKMMVKYKTKEVGYLGAKHLWHDALKATNTNRKGKLLGP
jgi:hypothetical protein